MAKSTCSVQGCGRPHDARGYCASHRARWWRYGDPLASAPSLALEEHFWSRVAKSKPDECWEWQGWRNTTGYGGFSMGSAILPGRLAHRIAWQLVHGNIPTTKHVLHHCDNPPCCNPAHLFLGDPAVNSADKVAKERQARGSGHGHAKLTEDAVRELRAVYSAGGVSQRALAERYGVSLRALQAALKARTWRHV